MRRATDNGPHPAAKRRVIYFVVGCVLVAFALGWIGLLAWRGELGITAYVMPVSVLTLGTFFVNPQTAKQWADTMLDRIPSFKKGGDRDPGT